MGRNKLTPEQQEERRALKRARAKANHTALRAAGLCTQCWVRPMTPGSRNCCYECLVRRREAVRERGGHSPRKQGGVGRPPIEEPT